MTDPAGGRSGDTGGGTRHGEGAVTVADPYRRAPGADGAPVLPSEASVEELRAQLEEIRRSLDDAERGIEGVRGPSGPPGPPPAELVAVPDGDQDRNQPLSAASQAPRADRTRRRRPALLVVVTVVTVLVVGALVATVLARRPTPGGATAAADAPPALVSQTPGDRPGVTAAGTDVSVTLGPDSQVVVREQATTTAPQRLLRLSQPDPAAAPSSLITLPEVTGLTASSRGELLEVTRTADGWTVQAPDGRELTQVSLGYTLQDAVLMQGAPGRALVVVTPLTAALSRAEGSPVQVRMSDGRVRQAACLDAPAADQLCGALGSTGWLTRVPDSATIPFVVFQLDLADGS